MDKYINFHKHTHYSNICTIDSTINYEDYINRIKELGYGMLFSSEHGIQGNYLEAYELAQKNNVKFGFGVEAYWVLDNKEKDKTNNHINILAKSTKGMKSINLALSYANIDGYYYKPRLSLQQILSLPQNDVFITTACVGFNGYGEEISKSAILELYNHFGDNFMLEVQYHHTELQKDWNRFLLGLNDEFGIKIIAGMDSHYIYPEQYKERDALLKSKNIHYENEDGWFMDYPSYCDAYDRFLKQDILSKEQIIDSLRNTLELEKFEDIKFNKDIKVPNIFPDKTYNERVEHFKDILRKSWNMEKENISIEKRGHYIEEIIKEINIVVETKMVDYFILNYYVIKRAKEIGGKLTLTSRGSAPSFYINKLLGFTTIDRISSPIQLFPERFMSVARILETGSIPDIDFNCGNPEVFIEAQRQVLGENSTYYMISYGKLKEKSAFKTYARAKDLDFDIANQISKNINEYEIKQKHSEKELKIDDYIDKKYLSLYNESKKYQGIIDSASRNPCATSSYSGNILEDVGVCRLRDEIVTIQDGKYMDKYKYVKNDFLKVNVVDVIYRVFNKINIPPIPSNKLIKMIEDDEKIWGLFQNGITLGLNQIEQNATKEKCMEYCPTNISELSAFCAAIRPGFASMLDKFLKRENFEYGIKDFDNLIQTEQMQDSWLLYQEQIMQTLQYAGFSSDECYGLIKSIAKKVQGVVEKVEDKFLKGFVANGNKLQDAKKVWKIIVDNSLYSFNSSHSLSVALDSAYGAYLKAYYPYEFYQVMLELYTDNKDIDKVSSLKKEMQYFDIQVGELKFGLDNTGFVSDKKNEIINQSLKSVKYINNKIPQELNKIYNPDLSFPEVVSLIKSETSTNSRQLDVLIKIGYFREFATIKKCLTFMEYCDKLKKKTYNKEKTDSEILDYIKPFAEETNKMYKNLDKEAIFNVIWDNLPNDEIDIKEKMQYELEYLGYISSEIPEGFSLAKVEYVSTKNRSANLKSFRTNKQEWFNLYKDLPVPKKNQIIYFNTKQMKKGKRGYILLNYEVIT